MSEKRGTGQILRSKIEHDGEEENDQEGSCRFYFSTGTGQKRLWEGKILESQYDFVHFDGLNRWYLAAERSELGERFDAPPNVFDPFELAATVPVCNRLAAAERELEKVRASDGFFTSPIHFLRSLVLT
jgi:hypothetical protein